jgi:hypothetical protein
VPTVVSASVTRSSATAHCSSTIGCGVVVQVRPHVGTVQPSEPMRRPIVTNRSWRSKPHVDALRGVPQLREGRIEVEEDARPDGGQQLLVGEHSRHVEQQVRARHAFEQRVAREAGGRSAGRVDERRVARQPEAVGDGGEALEGGGESAAGSTRTTS